jgi:hypothetical protein
VSNGGIIGVSNVPTQLSASGVWTLQEQFLARAQDIWPSRVPDVVLTASVWLDANDLSTITESGGAVSQWENKGSLGNFTQATGALQPTTGSATLNGRNVIEFAGDFLTSVDTAANYKFLHDGTTHLIAIVWRYTSGDFRGLMGTNTGSAAVGMAMFMNLTPNLQYDIYFGSSGNVAVRNLVSVSAATMRVMTMLNDPDNATAADRSEIFLNAGTATKGNTSSNSPSASNPAFTLQIGACGNNQLPFTGQIAELVVVSGANATEGNRVIIRDYLNAKWGVY